MRLCICSSVSIVMHGNGRARFGPMGTDTPRASGGYIGAAAPEEEEAAGLGALLIARWIPLPNVDEPGALAWGPPSLR